MNLQDTIQTIRAIWTNHGRGDYLPLTVVRAEFASYEGETATRAEQDEALKHLMSTHEANVIPNANGRALTIADHEAALWAGGELRHLIRFN